MPAAIARLWFNRHFSSVGRIVHLLRHAQEPLPLWICVSHRHVDFSGFAGADHALIEPAGLTQQDYLAWCLATVTHLGITHLLPGHEQSLLCVHANDFADRGCTVIAPAAPHEVERLHRKDWVYAQLRGLVPIPSHEIVASLDEALQAIGELSRHGEVCVKPCVSVYGKGFYRIDETARRASDYVAPTRAWAAMRRAEGAFAPHLVMRYLPGDEYSVDIAARHGELVAAVARRKDRLRKFQIIEDRPDLVRHAAAIVRRFRGNALLNIQFRDDAAQAPYLLEINPRAAGGIGMSCVSGVNLPDLALRAALLAGRAIDVPTPRTGIRVTELTLPVELPVPEMACDMFASDLEL